MMHTEKTVDTFFFLKLHTQKNCRHIFFKMCRQLLFKYGHKKLKSAYKKLKSAYKKLKSAYKNHTLWQRRAIVFL